MDGRAKEIILENLELGKKPYLPISDFLNQQDSLIKEFMSLGYSREGFFKFSRDHNVCKIDGSEITFNMTVPFLRIEVVAKDIWDNPGKYSDYKNGSDAAYYDFLKFLWITFPDGHEEQLSDFVHGCG